MLIIIHWVTCLFYVIIYRNYKYSLTIEKDFAESGKESEEQSNKFYHWMPPINLGDGKTDFFDLNPGTQFYQLYY